MEDLEKYKGYKRMKFEVIRVITMVAKRRLTCFRKNSRCLVKKRYKVPRWKSDMN